MKKRQENKTDEKIKALHNILDSKYFHICTTVDSRFQDNVKWVIYYKNLPEKVYYSEANKPLLTSEKNTIEDIYKLKEKFEEEKQKTAMMYLSDHFWLNLCVWRNFNLIKYKYREVLSGLLLLTYISNVVNWVAFQDVLLSIYSLWLMVILVLFSIGQGKEMDKWNEEAQNEIKEEFTKERIKRQGLYFLNRLK